MTKKLSYLRQGILDTCWTGGVHWDQSNLYRCNRYGILFVTHLKTLTKYTSVHLFKPRHSLFSPSLLLWCCVGEYQDTLLHCTQPCYHCCWPYWVQRRDCGGCKSGQNRGWLAITHHTFYTDILHILYIHLTHLYRHPTHFIHTSYTFIQTSCTFCTHILHLYIDILQFLGRGATSICHFWVYASSYYLRLGQSAWLAVCLTRLKSELWLAKTPVSGRGSGGPRRGWVYLYSFSFLPHG